MTLKLTDSQQWQVIRATNPLDMLERDAFLAALLQQFAGRTEIGDGELFRTLRELQRQHFRPPSATHIPHKFPQTAEAQNSAAVLISAGVTFSTSVALSLSLLPSYQLIPDTQQEQFVALLRQFLRGRTDSVGPTPGASEARARGQANPSELRSEPEQPAISIDHACHALARPGISIDHATRHAAHRHHGRSDIGNLTITLGSSGASAQPARDQAAHRAPAEGAPLEKGPYDSDSRRAERTRLLRFS